MTVLNATNETIRTLSLVQTAVDRALRDGSVEVYFRDGRGREIADALPDSAAGGDPFGYYTRTQGEIVRIRIVYYV
ncbi:MAG: hypothetical protein ABEI99_04215 [Halobaculum sp.]